ncbi:B12-binding domain-containing radical SAM protein [Heliobacterium chlorum]|uniref:B12-binding domain-containing radical SAM protein n=1 Tax=Heliobacterium chlorum TaxID=2698 RepID=A0ABR7T4A6_HELCL|nr:radical SAM protein [Heliobacterium chlorum]MBC9784511.1 B12-binding domain-containing radical SAM protein [Heliobacterium chlorum]
MKTTKVVLIGLYNAKALGVRCLSASLKNKGYSVNLIFFKDFNSLNASSPTEQEYHLLIDKLTELNPDVIGLSVMSSFYLSAAQEMSLRIKSTFPQVPLLWGGVYATLFPKEGLEHCDYLMRGECDEAIIDLVEALEGRRDITDVPNLCYKKDGQVIINEMNQLRQELDELPFPDMGGEGMTHISHGKLWDCDPLLGSISYEMSASRGCPYVCSYCSCLSLKRLYKNKGTFVRMRSVENTIEELKWARSQVKNMRMVWFWDEIFADDEEWVKEFVHMYKQEINLPFNIWGHPLKIKQNIIELLVNAGLHQIVIGIQHGSARIRKDIYYRIETDEQLIEMSRILAEAKVPEMVYDLILDSPFETVKDLEDTYHLCRKLYKPYTLNLHGLSFLPGTDIEKLAINQGLLTWEELKREQSKPIEEMYRSFSWWTHTGSQEDRERAYWKNMIYLTQFRFASAILPLFEKDFFRQKPETMNLFRTSANGWNLLRRVNRKIRLKLGIA